jgi:hypothetical protein
MKIPFTHHRQAGRRGDPDVRLDDLLPRHGPLFSATDRSCCCPATPTVMVVLPATVARAVPVDLLLCGHHFREHEAALRAAGAAIYDVNGALVGSGPTVDLSRAVPRQRPMPAQFTV